MRAWWEKNWAQVFAWVAIVLSIVAVLGVVFIAVPAYNRTQDQAEAGEAAQTRLTNLAPVSCLNYRAQLARGDIPRRGFDLAVDGLAVRCLPRPAPSPVIP